MCKRNNKGITRMSKMPQQIYYLKEHSLSVIYAMARI